MSNSLGFSVRKRVCYLCGGTIGTFVVVDSGLDLFGIQVSEITYKSSYLPIQDHVHDDSSQSLSFLPIAESSLQSDGRSSTARVSKSVEAVSGDCTVPAELSPYTPPISGRCRALRAREPYETAWDLTPLGSAFTELNGPRILDVWLTGGYK